MYPEIAAATPGRMAGAGAALRHAWTAVRHMFSPGRMARRVRLLANLDLSAELAQVRVATLVVTGEARLDRVVPVRLTRQYLDLWPHARVLTLERTGHLGLITKPEEFTRVVAPFVAENAGEALARNRGPRDAHPALRHGVGRRVG
jgi:pimeloyl-ACP methyl ester carboxylesterase